MEKNRKNSVLEKVAITGIFLIVVSAFFITYPVYQASYADLAITQEPFLQEKYISEKININLAYAEQLEVLPGIGEKKAQEIVRYREIHGDFKNIEELQNVKGIGEKTFNHLKDKICVA